jgi:hypothetical protein
MRPFESAKIILGLLAVVGALLLASPGVQVAPALAEEAVSTEEPGPQCSVDAQPRADAEVEALIAKLRQEQMARAAEGVDVPVMLNGRGYNYGPPSGIELDRIQAEARQAPSR